MYQVFPFTLANYVHAWFNGLAEGSISSFEQLRAEFTKTFIINSQRKKDVTYLISI